MPSVVGFEAVVAPAQGVQVVCGGGSAGGVGDAVVDVAAVGGLVAVRELAGGVAGADEVAQGPGWGVGAGVVVQDGAGGRKS